MRKTADVIELLPCSPDRREMLAFVAGLSQRIADALYPDSLTSSQPAEALELMGIGVDCQDVRHISESRAKSTQQCTNIPEYSLCECFRSYSTD
jgi:hypothetical protein